MSLMFKKFPFALFRKDCSTCIEITVVVSRICGREAQGKWWGGCKGKPILYKMIFILVWAILGHGSAGMHDHMH